MSISVNGHSTVPPGFRFHPTEEELLAYYLRKKVASEHIDLNVIRDIDLNKLEPWDIQEKCRIGTTPQNDWYFFSHKDKKYPTGTRTNRATAAGFWKATGRDKVIYTSFKRIGMRKTLVFYKGRAPHGQKSDWIMHEYRLDELYDSDSQSNSPNVVAENQFAQEEGWVICRVFKKKSHHRLSVDPTTCSPLRRSDSKPPHIVHSTSDSSLDQILQYKTAKSDGHHHYGGHRTRNPQPMDTLLSRATTLIHERFTKLPPLGSPATAAVACCQAHPVQRTDGELSAYNSRETGFGDWAVLDRLVSYDLDAYPFCPPTSRFLGDGGCGGGGEDDGDLWSLTRSATLSGSAHVSYVSHDK